MQFTCLVSCWYYTEIVNSTINVRIFYSLSFTSHICYSWISAFQVRQAELCILSISRGEIRFQPLLNIMGGPGVPLQAWTLWLSSNMARNESSPKKIQLSRMNDSRGWISKIQNWWPMWQSRFWNCRWSENLWALNLHSSTVQLWNEAECSEKTSVEGVLIIWTIFVFLLQHPLSFLIMKMFQQHSYSLNKKNR